MDTGEPRGAIVVNNGWGKVVGLAAVMVIVAMVPIVIGWGSIPDPFASHWGPNGQPDASLPKWALPLLPVGLVVLGGLVAVLFRVNKRPSAEGVALLTFLGVMGVVATMSTVALNSGAESWQAADPMRWTHITAVIVLPLVAGILGYRVGKRWYPLERTEISGSTTPIAVAPGETVAWIGTCRVRYPFVIAAASALGLVLLPGPWRWITVPFFIVALVLSHVRVTVNNQGLKARLGGVFSKQIPLSEMSQVEAVELNPNEWGGWGYRMAPGRSAMVLRRGEAIDIQLGNGRRFAVTVDDAATGAGLLKGLLEHS